MSEEYKYTPETVKQNLIKFFSEKNNSFLVEILQLSKSEIEFISYDNWNEGHYSFCLHLQLPMNVFAPNEERINGIEKIVLKALNVIFNGISYQSISSVTVKPIVDESHFVNTLDKPTPDDIDRVWGEAPFKVFLSHSSKYKDRVFQLKQELNYYGLSCFVAHEDVEPTLEWEKEIKYALNSTNLLIVLLTPDFHDRLWTDQEVGIALGRNIPLIYVKLGRDPYGFMGKIQALKGDFEDIINLSINLVRVLLKKPECSELMHESLVVSLEKAYLYDIARKVIAMIVETTAFSKAQMQRIKASYLNNSQVSENSHKYKLENYFNKYSEQE